jgi:hypothetical protein
MDDFIKVYDNVLDNNLCDTLIRLFDVSGYKEIINNKGTPNFTQLNINQKHPDNIQQVSDSY